jgi:hypothetical protein
VRFVQPAPTGAHLRLSPELSGRRRTAELDERRVRAVAKVE